MDQIPLALEEEVPARTKPAASKEWAGLTRRELEIAELVAQGTSNKEIAGGLVISTRTVEAHVERILTKLAVHLPDPDRRVDDGTHGRTPGGAPPPGVTVW